MTVEVASGEPRKRLLKLMDEMGAEAAKRGLTPAILDEILNDK